MNRKDSPNHRSLTPLPFMYLSYFLFAHLFLVVCSGAHQINVYITPLQFPPPSTTHILFLLQISTPTSGTITPCYPASTNGPLEDGHPHRDHQASRSSASASQPMVSHPTSSSSPPPTSGMTELPTFSSPTYPTSALSGVEKKDGMPGTLHYIRPRTSRSVC